MNDPRARQSRDAGAPLAGGPKGGPAGDLALFGRAPVVSVDAHRLWPVVGEDERRALARVLDRGILSGSFAPEAMAFQDEFAAFVGAKYALLTHCGTSALSIALAAAGVRPGDEVIVPAYSFVATPLAVAHVGAIPVFADVDRATGCLDLGSMQAAITPRTRAIMPVHMHGLAADIDAILEVARAHRLLVVEDAAQAHGALCAGRPVGAIGAAGGFSLQSSKNLSAGEGGVFVTNDPGLADAANSVRNFGQDLLRSESGGFDSRRPLDGSRSLDSKRLGSMFRGNEMMAAFARAQLAQLPARTERCQRNADRLSRALNNLPGVSAPVAPQGRTSVHHKYRVHIDARRAGVELSPELFRDAVMRALRAEGLEVVLWQSVALPAQTVFQERAASGGFPAPAEDGTDLAVNYDPAKYPQTNALLAGSFILFSQSCPLIAQTDDLIDRYAEAFRRVWHERQALSEWASRQAS